MSSACASHFDEISFIDVARTNHVCIEARRRRERNNIRAALERSGGRIYGPDGAANLLGINPTTLVSRLKALGLRRPSTLRPK